MLSGAFVAHLSADGGHRDFNFGEHRRSLLLAEGSGTTPCPARGVARHYERHWTPVHIDFHVDDFKLALEKAISAGAIQEQLFEGSGRPSVAFCCDPFGHGFCLIESRKR